MENAPATPIEMKDKHAVKHKAAALLSDTDFKKGESKKQESVIGAHYTSKCCTLSCTVKKCIAIKTGEVIMVSYGRREI